MRRIISIISLLFMLPLFSLAQQDYTMAHHKDFKNLHEAEDYLKQILVKLRQTEDRDKINAINQTFKSTLENVLEMYGAFDYPFDALKTVGSIYSDDKLVRIFSWNLQYKDLSNNYFSIIMKKNKFRGQIDIIPLVKKTENIKAVQFKTVDETNWYGGLYYDIIDVQRRRRTFYTLLGYEYHNHKTRIKFIDVLYFTGKVPHFGYPLFKADHDRKNRVIFEYSAKAVMSLDYDSTRNMIIFDHLSPLTPQLKDFRAYYVPDMSYNAYIWDGRYWILKKGVIAVNSKTKEQDKVALKAYDKDLDSVVTIYAKKKWLNPTDKDAPIDGGKHQAVTPESIKEAQKNEKDNNSSEPKVRHNRRKSDYKRIKYSHLEERIND